MLLPTPSCWTASKVWSAMLATFAAAFSTTAGPPMSATSGVPVSSSGMSSIPSLSLLSPPQPQLILVLCLNSFSPPTDAPHIEDNVYSLFGKFVWRRSLQAHNPKSLPPLSAVPTPGGPVWTQEEDRPKSDRSRTVGSGQVGLSPLSPTRCTLLHLPPPSSSCTTPMNWNSWVQVMQGLLEKGEVIPQPDEKRSNYVEELIYLNVAEFMYLREKCLGPPSTHTHTYLFFPRCNICFPLNPPSVTLISNYQGRSTCERKQI